MKIRVILFGTLRKSFSDHDPLLGMEVEIPEGSTVGDLIAHIDLPAKKIRPGIGRRTSGQGRKPTAGKCGGAGVSTYFRGVVN